jgi:signal transduction histidine kinase
VPSALRHAEQVGGHRRRRWRGQLRRASALGPAYFTMLVRWASWAAALAMVLLGDAARPSGVWLAFLLTCAVNGAFTVGYLLFHRRLRTILRAPGLRRADGRALWAALDLVVSLGVMQATGGLWSPFHIYALTSVMFPALVFRWSGALVAATAFAAFQVLAVALQGGLATLRPAEQVDTFISVIVNAYLIAGFSAYLASLLRGLDAERQRTARAWRETSALYAVAQTILESPPEPPVLCERVTHAVEHHLRLPAFAIYLAGHGDAAPVASYGLPREGVAQAEECVQVPLCVEGREVGWLVARHRGAPDATEALLRALAGQMDLGLRNVALVREKAALATEGERARLAREIHDGVAQSLYMLALNLEACAEMAERGAGLRPRLEQLLRLARQALWEVRHYIFDLQPLLGGAAPLGEVLRNPLREFQTITGLTAELTATGAERPLPPAARAAVYRVLQESLANTFKYGKATRVTVALDWGPTALTLSVRDDGQGFDPASITRGHGLDNLHQRAAEIGGTATVESAPGAGTAVCLVVPYAGASAPSA